MASVPNIAFVGPGPMGIGMASRLLHAGYSITGYDLNPDAAETLGSKGDHLALSPRQAANAASVLICMAATADQATAILFDKSVGAVDGLRQNSTIILCSTVTPGYPIEVRSLLDGDAKRPDIRLIDCPVSGDTALAPQGTQTIFASGPGSTLEAMRSILDAMADNLYFILGGLGATNKVKTINQQ